MNLGQPNKFRSRPLVYLLATAALLAPAAAPAAPRVVALTPFSANTVANLGLRPVGMGQVLGGFDRISPRLRGVKTLPLSHPAGPNLEQLAQLNPRLVLSSHTWRRGHGAMGRLGIRVAETEPRNLAGVAFQTRRIGKLLGRRAAARRLAGRINRRIASARRGIRRHPRVLVIVGVGRTPYALLENSWGGDLVRKAGGRLLTRGLRASGGIARISNEIVVQRNPDVIIAIPHGSPDDISSLARYYQDNPAWRSTRAARRNRIYVSTGNSLLQPWTDPWRTIRDVRKKFLHN
jgi:iron complex transport system substrate-binding protein